MKKVMLCLFVILVIGTMVYGGDGPFGLEMGMRVEEVTAVLGETPSPNAIIGTKTLRYGYSVSAAKIPPEFESFTLTITSKAGLCEIYLRTGEFPIGSADTKSPDPKTVYPKLVDMVTSQYGPPVQEAKIPSEDDIFGGAPLDLSTTWMPGKHGIEKITLGWVPTSLGSLMSILYVFDNRYVFDIRNEAMKEYPLKETLKLPKETPKLP